MKQDKTLTQYITNYALQMMLYCREAIDYYFSEPLLRIVKERQCAKTGDISFVVHLTSKDLFPTFKAKELVEEQAILDNFSKTDKTRILRAARGYADLAEYRVLAKTFNKNNDTLYTIESIVEGKPCVKSITEHDIANTVNINDFDKKDIFTIAYTIGSRESESMATKFYK